MSWRVDITPLQQLCQKVNNTTVPELSPCNNCTTFIDSPDILNLLAYYKKSIAWTAWTALTSYTDIYSIHQPTWRVKTLPPCNNCTNCSNYKKINIKKIQKPKDFNSLHSRYRAKCLKSRKGKPVAARNKEYIYV